MARYNVGDMVRVRPDLTNDTIYDGVYAVDNMERLSGKMVKIVEIIDDPTRDIYYIENSRWMWTNPMFLEEKYDFPSKSDLMQLLEG